MMRPDLVIISDWISPGARVLDLGCGDGTLLDHLQRHRSVTGYGLEIDVDNVAACIARGVSAIHTDLDRGLSEFGNQSFDFVVMTQAIQVLQRPDAMLREMLRIGQRVVVTLPNFGHWSTRLQLLLKGRMPRTNSLPAQWYDTDNIHLCTLRDFEALCRDLGVTIARRSVTDHQHQAGLPTRWVPNLTAEIGIYMLEQT